MIEVVCNDRLGKKIRVKCNEDDTIGDLKKLIAAQVGQFSFLSLNFAFHIFLTLLSTFSINQLHIYIIGTRAEKIRIQKWYLLSNKLYLKFYLIISQLLYMFKQVYNI